MRFVPGLGGQTGLNLAMQLQRKGVLDECQVEILGTSFESIEMAEDREKFKELCERAGRAGTAVFDRHQHGGGLPCGGANRLPGGAAARRLRWAARAADSPTTRRSCAELLKNALKLSPVHQVLVEKSIKGYKEIEYEVMRDANDTAIAICNMENIDPVGVHTGDSIVLSPQPDTDQQGIPHAARQRAARSSAR